ncbi:outer membrane receptor for ferrienterochelin and colicins [Catalinimonas alkaloidigena]|uniref:Outer membrane receptor for ferrienterochelin and colicins n=1 Tax=Catalinimonas alkaloidigena TaxID=1075417 RepID=A0A1G9UL84_9BACT|nr:TonB-dependent receptor [Catalinimonas alkaloidigena]SDM60682.1 outer membrane receptor for ferrienterochelin and colicins [Catalinimonas alkaloidigena]
MPSFYTILLTLLATCAAVAQTGQLRGRITSAGQPLEFVNVGLEGTTYGNSTDADGRFLINNIPFGTYTVRMSAIGYETVLRRVQVQDTNALWLDATMNETQSTLNEVVVTGTMKEVSKMESPVPVEVYTPQFFRKNPTPNLFDALQNVNGVRPQLNCNICNTGDIHINGLEGPYTMVMIDGMPIVSSLSSVYGLSGIPNSLVERIEVVKGPASSLYGSEAVGGLINIITKKPANAPLFTADVFGTSWAEVNADLGYRYQLGNKVDALAGINYYNYQVPMDRNGDNFTDVTLQHRISLFNKWSLQRKEHRLASLAARYFYEDRWGGEMQWTPAYRGGDTYYGESIYTSRWELIGNYQLPVREKLNLWFSYNDHQQNSYYGTTPYRASQRIAFGQLLWDKEMGHHSLLTGMAFRYTFYDDNTPATATFAAWDGDTTVRNQPDRIALPGVFVQDELTISPEQKLLLGARYDYNSVHGHIVTPRLAYKWTFAPQNVLRLNAGTGYRVVNLFTEDHAALTGARQVVIEGDLRPERTYNVNLNYVKHLYTANGHAIGLDLTGWYTYFNNKILPDYLTDPNKIVYRNLRGHAESVGLSLNADVVLNNGLKLLAGGTLMDVSTLTTNEQGALVRQRQLLTERWMGTWTVSYTLRPWNLTVDYTGNLYGPMRLPVLGELDPRPDKSPVWSIQNIQLSKPLGKRVELYGGVKNLLNWTPNRNSAFLIARAHDPFDRGVQFDSEGQVRPTAENPYALTFDPSYVYAPNQGIRGFLGVRWTLR